MGRKSRSKKLEPTTQTETPLRETPASESRPTNLFIAAALVVLTLLVYAGVRSNEFLEYDDNVYITHNTVIRQGLTLHGLRWSMTSMDFNWHPVTWITHMLDVTLFGVDSAKHHLMNVAFHCANVAMLFLLLQRMTGARWRSAIAAAIFAVHPLHVESVAWVAERKDVLSTFFLMITLLLYVRWTRRSSWPTYAAMSITFILGLASKQMLVTVPFALLLLDYWPLRRLDLNDTKLIVRRVVEKIPLFLITIAAVAIAIIGQRAVKAVVSITKLPLTLRIENALVTYCIYLRKTFIPTPLAMPYPYVVPSTAAIAISVLVLILVTAVVIVYRDRRYLFTGWFWFVGTLVPVIGIIQIGSQGMADRYTYIPQIGLLMAVIWLLADLARTSSARRVLAGVAAVVILAFAVSAKAYVAKWRDTETLFRHDIAVTDRNYIAHSNLGSQLAREARYDEAKAEFKRALAIEPVDANALVELAELHLKHGERAEAVPLLERAIKVEPTPRVEAKLALARNDIPKAVQKYGEVVADNPFLVENHVDYAATLALAGKDEEALAQNREALRLDPAHYDALMNVGALLSRMNRNDEALADFRKAAEVNPSSPEPHVYLALIQLSMGRRSDALAEARIAAQVNHDASNLILTNALHMPFKPANLDDFIAFLETGNAPAP